MKEKKTDRRVKYTKMVIRQSFVKLLKQKSISTISIKEICEDADINRATFYAHYKNQYDLLNQIENEAINDIKRYLNSYDFEMKDEIPIHATEKILEYIKKNSELFDLLLNLNGDTHFQQEIIEIVGKQYFIPARENSLLKRDEAEYIFHFLASGSICTIQKWLKEGMKKPIGEIAELILTISINGIKFFN